MKVSDQFMITCPTVNRYNEKIRKLKQEMKRDNHAIQAYFVTYDPNTNLVKIILSSETFKNYREVMSDNINFTSIIEPLEFFLDFDHKKAVSTITECAHQYECRLLDEVSYELQEIVQEKISGLFKQTKSARKI